MGFFVPFVLGAVAAVTGIHVLKNRDGSCKDQCSCGCGDDCECGPDCDCNCNSSSVKKRVSEKAGIALDKIKSGLHILENNINETTMEKVRSGLQTVESKIAVLQEKLKEEKSSKS